MFVRSKIPNTTVQSGQGRIPKKKKSEKEKMAGRVEQKLAQGDIRGAVRTISSDTGLAPFTEETANLLKEKHPPAQDQSHTREPATTQVLEGEPLSVCEDEVLKAIRSFPAGSSAGPDGPTPDYLKDLTFRSAGDAGVHLLTYVTREINLILRGEVCSQVLPILFGASLCALEKKGGGIRPIAVGNTIRRVAGKVISTNMQQDLGNYLRPVQLGYGTKAGCEAAIHSVRQYMQEENSSARVILKGDYTNAFNSVHRHCILREVHRTAPKAYHYALQAYGQQSTLFFGEYRISSARGVQQGDPLGPLFFSLGIHNLATSLFFVQAKFLSNKFVFESWF